MNRQPKSEKSADHLSVVVDAYTTVEGDCFGKDWDLHDNACTMCGMQSVCAVLTTSSLKKAADLRDAAKNPFVDEIDFSLVPKTQLLELLKAQAYPIDSLRNVFKEFSKCADDKTVAIQVNYFIRENSLTTENGYVRNYNQ